MTFPAAGEYQSALQHPGFCFAGTALATVEPERTPLGLPRPISGNFASVFPVRTPDGRRHALKCFTRPAADQFTRYEAIAEELSRRRPSWAVGMDFHRSGIRVNGAWYPLLRMDWAEAVPLTQWVNRNIGARRRLLAVAERFTDVVRDLEAGGLAHGDLQHGNILIGEQDELRLVDYDGMYLPALAAYAPDEVGHPNFQHPARGPGDYGPAVDRFSAWLISLSLRALAADADLWHACNPDHEEYLLLKKADLADPFLSRRVAFLQDHADSQVRSLAEWLYGAYSAPPELLPALHVAQPAEPPPRPTAPAPRTVSGAAPLPSWLASRLAAEPPGSPAPAPRSCPRSGGDSEGADTAPVESPPIPPIRLGPIPADFPVHRGVRWGLRAVPLLPCCVAVALVLGVVPRAFTAIPFVTCALLVLLLVLWAARVRGSTELRRATVAVKHDSAAYAGRLRTARQPLIAVEKELAEVIAAIEGLDRDYEVELRKLEGEQAKRRAAAQGKPRELAGARSKLRGEEELEVQTRLAQRQREHVRRRLADARLQSGLIAGIGRKLVANLRDYGIESAADFQGIGLRAGGGRYNNVIAVIQLTNGRYVDVPGIGPAKAQALDQWRQIQTATAQNSRPSQLGRVDRQDIRERFDRRGRELDNQIRAANDAVKQLDSRFGYEKDQVFTAHRAFKQARLTELTPRRSSLEARRAAATESVRLLEAEITARRKWLGSAPGPGFTRYLRKQVF